jgi:hypothetical protein
MVFVYYYGRQLELFYIICILLRTSVKIILRYLYIITDVRIVLRYLYIIMDVS